MNLTALHQYIESSPLTWLIITLAIYKLGIIIYELSGKKSFLQPIIITYISVLFFLIFTNTKYEHYFESVSLIHFFLAPATVALALPLYNNIKYIKAFFFPMMISLIFCSAFTVLISIFALFLFDVEIEMIMATLTKSITIPIAIVTSEQIGAIASIATCFVVIVGLSGAIFGTFAFKIARVKNDESKGFALGLISHGIGTARATQISEKAGAFSALAMGINGILTAILLPLIMIFLK